MRIILSLVFYWFCTLATSSQSLGVYSLGKPFGWYNTDWVWYQQYPDTKIGYHIRPDKEIPVFDQDGNYWDTCRQNVLARGIRLRPFSVVDSSEFCQPELPNTRFALNGFMEKDCDHRFDTIYAFIGAMTYYPAESRFCNTPYIHTRNASITYLSDSLISIEVKLAYYHLPDSASLEMEAYRGQLRSFAKQEKEINEIKNERKRRKKLHSLYADTIRCPQLFGEAVTHPYYRKIFKHGERIGDNHRWVFFKDTAQLHEVLQGQKLPTLDSVTYRAFVLNPFNPWNEVKLHKLFGKGVYQLIETEMAKLAKNSPIHFNKHHYEEQYKRQFMWGLEPGNLIIYYGNEGEFGAYAKHRIPFSYLLKNK